jgi:hypothetical protein
VYEGHVIHIEGLHVAHGLRTPGVMWRVLWGSLSKIVHILPTEYHATYPSETVDFYQTVRRNIPEVSHLQYGWLQLMSQNSIRMHIRLVAAVSIPFYNEKSDICWWLKHCLQFHAIFGHVSRNQSRKVYSSGTHIFQMPSALRYIIGHDVHLLQIQI